MGSADGRISEKIRDKRKGLVSFRLFRILFLPNLKGQDGYARNFNDQRQQFSF
jgi:hypothetical protein